MKVSYLVFFIFLSQLLFSQAGHSTKDDSKPKTKGETLVKIFYSNKDTATIKAVYKIGSTDRNVKLTYKDKKILPFETDSIYIIRKSLQTDTFIGRTYKKAWLFNTLTGPIKAYARVPVNDSYLARYYQYETDKIYTNSNRFRSSILGKMVKDSPEAYKLWKKSRMQQYGKIAGIVVSEIGAITAAILIKGPLNKLCALGVGQAGMVVFVCLPIIPPNIISDCYNASKRKKEIFFE